MSPQYHLGDMTIFGANPNIGGIAYHITERNTPDEPETPSL
jgi:hypothetical protein